MVERVHSTRSFGFANASGDQRLDVLRLDLDVDSRAGSNRVERFRKRWNSRPVREKELSELRGRELGDRPMRSALRTPGVDDRIVMNDDDPIHSSVHVQLNAVCTQLNCALERGYRVLGMGLVRPPVGDSLGRIAA